MTTFAIEAHGLVKRYGDLTAVAGIDLAVPRGSIYAMLGPNGAGKTTTINMLTTLIVPTAGSASVAGYDVVRAANQVRTRIGVTFQDIVVDQDLTGREVLDIHGRLYRQPTAVRQRRISELVELVQLTDAIDRRVRTYSGGMKRRLELARGLMTDPEILFLDEPTQGLDPQNRVGIWNYIRDLNQTRDLTLLLTTHYMDEAEALAARVGIVDKGRLVVEDAPATLVSNLGADVIRVRGQGERDQFVAHLKSVPFVIRVDLDTLGEFVLVYVDSGSRRLAEIVASAGANHFQIDDVTVARPSLGDVFLHHTGNALRD
ncbi:ATP-binding cassette domain-containing protein [Candidatus Chloroploca sp. M-50]|uniref:ATP-binding cassette domain-containing protein n=1 Tax=Candidatus Chloroploca mongolica TaxID=2528176 RepID=A0ABS4D5D2_9CHLR|nr:ATP-binding cassette domain-containing protein [Candidatus Chloroploca mongolica]MBP1464623.1 ATP-binding cassette domain-containing protein [Candidatus Chloroploca mongolica]